MRMTFVSVTSGDSGSLGEAYIYTPVHQEGPLHYEEKAGTEHKALRQIG
ncbi:Uncharacterised protein [marine metagenome]